MNVVRLSRWLALFAGAMDFCTGLLLIGAPGFALDLMRVPPVSPGETVYLRWVGAFVAAVGATYLWAFFRAGLLRLRFTLELTLFFRLAAGSYSAWAILQGALNPAWWTVPVTDFLLFAVQLGLLKFLPSRDESLQP